MLYIQCWVNVNVGNVVYCYGNDIGIVFSCDYGRMWVYCGVFDFNMERGKNIFWVLEVVNFNGVYYLFVFYIEGV